MARRDRSEYLARYLEKNRANVMHLGARARDELRAEMVEAYGGCCQHCGEKDPIVLTLDHINDDPGPEYEVCGKSSRGGYTLYRRLRNEGWPRERFQLLCFNCNMRKEHARRRAGMIARWGEPPEPNMLSVGEIRAKTGPSRNNQSGFKGVIWLPARNRWQAQIRAHDRFVYIGRYADIRDAAKAYRAKALELWGDLFAPLTDAEIEEIAARPRTVIVRKRGVSGYETVEV